jgi:prevent-host-death family protein
MMKDAWQLQEAKNKFSELVNKARTNGPQVVTKMGKESVVVLSIEDYRKLIKPKYGFAEFISKSPLKCLDLDLDRNKSLSRDVWL